VEKEGYVESKRRAFSSCADFRSRVLENRKAGQLYEIESVGKVIHFSMGHYGYYEVCLYSFSKNREYPSLLLAPGMAAHARPMSGRKDASGYAWGLLFGNMGRGIQI
jgi:hypothetical protein